MHAQLTPRQAAPMAARGVLGLRRCVRPNAFGNALGSSLASASWGGGQQEPRADAGSFIPTDANWQKLFSDASAAPRYPGVQVADFVRNDGSYVNERGIDIVGEPTLVDDAPQIPIGLLPQGAEPSSVFAFKDKTGSLFYGMRMPDGNDVAKHQSVFFPDNEQTPAQPYRVEISGVGTGGAAAEDFQASIEQKVVAGTYNRFNEIGNAWSAGNYGDVWRHATFEASAPARAAVNERLFPQPTPEIARIDRMLSSPIGTIFSGAGRLFGASQQTQDALLATGSFAEQMAGARTNVYKQTLTAPPPMPGTAAARPRGLNAQPANPLDVGTYATQARRSVGDAMSPDHIPSFAAIRLSVESKLGRQLTPAEATKLRNETNTLMIDTDLHQQSSRTYGGRNTQDQVSRDALNLGGAALRDEVALRPQLASRGYTQQQIDEAFARLHAANKAKGWY